MDMSSSEMTDHISLHRQKVYIAENSRLAGERPLAPDELDRKMEELFDHEEDSGLPAT